MYETHHGFDELEEGSVVLWNGQEREIEYIYDSSAIIGGELLSMDRINNMFKSPDEPFEIVK